MKLLTRDIFRESVFERDNHSSIINPTKITDFNRSIESLQEFWLFCIFVAGKNSDIAASKLRELSDVLPDGNESLFDKLKKLSATDITDYLVKAKVGQYGRITNAILDTLMIDIDTASLEDLLNIRGVGPKTARFFLLHSRKDCSHAVLDTHILKWLSRLGYSDVPKATPQVSRIYSHREKIFVDRARKMWPNLSIAEIDLLIWSEVSGRK